MVHQQSYDHRHSSYHPPPAAFSETSSVMNKNYEQQQQGGDHSLRKIGKNNNNNNNNASSSPSASSNAVNDNDTFARFWPQPANNAAATSGAAPLLAGHPCGPINSGANGNNHAAAHASVENDVRWSKLLRHDGTPTKVLLYPEEGWARTATNAYWLLSIPWWNRNRCKVVEVAGTRRSTTQAKLIDAGDRRTVYVVGSFKSSSTTSADLSSEPQFKLALTSHITTADVNLGYLMTGTLERGRHSDSLQPTHFAVLRKFDWNNP
ncbi:uncharacterized protein LOC130700464 [Daphnia carinata]|uniref:uncharacterized protein LOC130700464 n=1 Tax=Daphnia carinata TaxID=120202 RepID=UPI00257E08C1|nr:uncharacterized protein LOC130700464 [Daphnia carinata]